ncbi:Spy/CpxP family protein refolding chaperone [Brevundimonas sp.]|uniref:Spy/CpxP family protein refolding chaperone n=1 Tax=Brevundimonas sp. TaxID=1871086 RepID=UPI0025B9913A|nr:MULTISPECIES: periplasmic heavy metal sensor [unclassified Brevundimonas]
MAVAWKSIAVTVALAAAASGIGAWAGATWVLNKQTPPSLHEIVHKDLDLSSEQHRKIDSIEDRFAEQRLTLEGRVQAANRELAEAIRVSNGDSRVVQPAVDHFHDAMGDLQQATIAHIFEMRSVMTDAQARRFDRSMVEALSADAR